MKFSNNYPTHKVQNKNMAECKKLAHKIAQFCMLTSTAYTKHVKFKIKFPEMNFFVKMTFRRFTKTGNS